MSSEGDTAPSVPDTTWTKPEGELADGTYSDTERGMFGNITVNVTISGGQITEITQTNELETAYVGVPAMENTLIPAVIEAQDPNVETVAGATMTSNAFRTAVQKCLEQAAA